nr:GntR family transcriptional regulator [Micromonospora sp. A200]
MNASGRLVFTCRAWERCWQSSRSRQRRWPWSAGSAQTYGVARGTVRMAIRELRDRGPVVTVHARGTFVAEQG